MAAMNDADSVDIDPDLPDAVKATVTAMMSVTPHAKALGLKVTRLSRGRAFGRAPFRDDLVGDPDTGVIAGGVIIAFLDHLAGMAALTMLDQIAPIATLDLRIDYMRAAHPRADVMAAAHCYKLTRSIAFVRAVAYDESEDDPIANATGAFMLSSTTAKFL